MRSTEALVIDCFAGGGGASMGIEQALGRPVDVAINHDPEAVAMHEANHPRTRHYTQDVWQVDPLQVVDGREVALAWFSPDCKHFSKAKGGKPREKGIRDLAWVVIEWARRVRPAVILLENVEEFRTWGPLDDSGQPIKAQSGETFAEWLSQLRGLGYRVETRELRACDYGAPTIRRRLFIVARCDGLPIRWPAPTHGKAGSGLRPYRTAAECIDWSIVCPSIFERKRPLAEATLKRIANGIRRFVIEAAEPFIVTYTHQGGDRAQGVSQPFPTVTGAHRGEMGVVTPFVVKPNHTADYYHAMRGQPLDEPLQTITQDPGFALTSPFLAQTGHKGANGSYVNDAMDPLRVVTSQEEHALIAPTLIQTGYGERDGQAPRVPGLDKPLGTVVGAGKHAEVVAFLAKHFGGATGVAATEPLPTILSKAAQTQVVAANIVRMNHDGAGKDTDAVDEPLRTVTTQSNKHLLMTSHLAALYGTSTGRPTDTPAPTVTAGGGHIAEVRAFLTAYYGTSTGQPLRVPLGTVTSKDTFGVVMIHGEPYQIVDIGIRMLAPRELFKAQGFPDGYIIDRRADGSPLTKTAQIRLCGNSVCPDVARALVEANVVAFTHQSELWRGHELAAVGV